MRKKYLIGLFVILGAFSYLVWASFSASFQYALTPTELIAKQGEYAGKSAKVSGIVEEGSIVFSGGEYRFNITDGSNKIAVHYNKGTVPNMFREGGDVVVGGTFSNGVFEAREVLAKCASKYVPK